MTTVLKLGGSLITDKTEVEVIDRTRLKQVSKAIGAHADEPLVVIHGGGSFGHHAASEHGISTERGTRDPRAVRSVTRAMDQLNDEVVDALQAVGIPAIGLPPRALAVKDEDGDLTLASLAIERLVEEGFVPVLHGDLVAHARKGTSVLSGDTIAVEVTQNMPITRVGFCSGVPGVLDESGSVISYISAFDDVATVLRNTDGEDVSGGMATKVRSLLAIDVPGAIFGIDALDAFLRGELPGTRVETADTDPF